MAAQCAMGIKQYCLMRHQACPVLAGCCSRYSCGTLCAVQAVLMAGKAGSFHFKLDGLCHTGAMQLLTHQQPVYCQAVDLCCVLCKHYQAGSNNAAGLHKATSACHCCWTQPTCSRWEGAPVKVLVSTDQDARHCRALKQAWVLPAAATQLPSKV